MDDIVEVMLKGTNNQSKLFVHNEPIECPYCKVTMMPNLLYSTYYHHLDFNCEIFCQCSNPKCKASFVSIFHKTEDSHEWYFDKFSPTPSLKKKRFDDIIRKISPTFIAIYNQAYQAEQMKLSHICGMGYRKALEFLIKDYLISNTSYEEETIKKVQLGNCITNYVQDYRIKETAKRAVWLGNDETHYVREWENKDINDLKGLIELTIYWIEAEEKFKDNIRSMPEKKKKH